METTGFARDRHPPRGLALRPATRLTLDWSMNFSSLSYGSQIAVLAGMRVDSPGDSGQWALRAQLQLLV